MIDAVHRKRSERVGLGVTGIPNLLGSMEQVVFVFELGHPSACLRRPRLLGRFAIVIVVAHIVNRWLSFWMSKLVLMSARWVLYRVDPLREI